MFPAVEAFCSHMGEMNEVMNQRSTLMRYRSAPSNLLSSFLDLHDWNDFSGSSLSSIAESEGPGSVFDEFVRSPIHSGRPADVGKLPGISETPLIVKDLPMLQSFNTELPMPPLDIFSFPELPDVWHPSQESQYRERQQTGVAGSGSANTCQMAFAEADEKVGCISSSTKSGIIRHDSSRTNFFDQLHLGMPGVLGSMEDRQDSTMKDAVFQTTENQTAKPMKESGLHVSGQKTTKSLVEGSSSRNQMITSSNGCRNTALPLPRSWDFAVHPGTGFERPEQVPSARSHNKNSAPLARSASLPVTTTPKSAGLENVSSHYLGPCQTRAKRGCATHPRSIAERLRRTRISEKMRKLQELVPNMDKQLNTADMLDEAVEYVKFLQQQVKELSQNRAITPLKMAELCESQ